MKPHIPTDLTEDFGNLSTSQLDLLSKDGRFNLVGADVRTIAALQRRGILTTGCRLTPHGRKIRKVALQLRHRHSD